VGPEGEEKEMRTTTTTGRLGLGKRLFVLLAAMVVGGVILAVQGPAVAHDHRIPRTALMEGDQELQTGLKVAYSSWTDIMRGETVTVTARYEWRFPDKDRVPAGAELRTRIFKSERPDTFSVTTYPKAVRKNGEQVPSGEGRQLMVSLEPVVGDGRTVAWDAVFQVDRPDRHYYLITEGHWRDVQGAGADQHAFWSFHAKTRNAS
jgi:hypothetical protein